MTNVPADLKYSKTHEWVREDGDGNITVGVTDHAQELLGDLVFVELPEVGGEVAAEGECGVVESVKAASDLYSPVAGTVVEVNETLADAPEIINEDPYQGGWVFRLAPADATAITELMDADDYMAFVAAEEH